MQRFLISLLLMLLPAMAMAVPVKELVAEKARETLGAELPSEGEFRITMQTQDTDEALMLSAFWMDRTTGQFLANAVREDGKVTRLQGIAVLMVPVPVPVRRIAPGEMVGGADVQIIDLPFARVGAFVVTDPANLIGKQVRRMLPQGRPVMMQSVTEPLVISRGDKVSIRFEDGKLSLSVPGRALNDGYQGEQVRVVNLVSNILVTGLARSGGTVEVQQ